MYKVQNNTQDVLWNTWDVLEYIKFCAAVPYKKVFVHVQYSTKHSKCIAEHLRCTRYIKLCSAVPYNKVVLKNIYPRFI